MAPTASRTTPSTSTSDDKDDFTWDHSVLTLRRFLIRLIKFLNSHPKFKSYAMGNFCSTHGGRTAVYSDEQAAAIQQDKVRGLGFSMEKPMPAGHFKRTNTPLEATRVANYTISPETLHDCMETFLTEILDRMEDSGSAEEYRKLCRFWQVKVRRSTMSSRSPTRSLCVLSFRIARSSDCLPM